VACVALGIYQVKLAWNALPVHIGPIRFSLTIYPPLVICLWMLFWLGFEWAFLSAYLATFWLAVYSGMKADWAACCLLWWIPWRLRCTRWRIVRRESHLTCEA